MFNGDVFFIYVDDNFVGIVEDEMYIYDMASNSINGITQPLTDDDMGDRLYYEKININQFYRSGKNIVNKNTNESILCANTKEAQKGVDMFNDINLQKERAEAYIRAINL